MRTTSSSIRCKPHRTIYSGSQDFSNTGNFLVHCGCPKCQRAKNACQRPSQICEFGEAGRRVCHSCGEVSALHLTDRCLRLAYFEQKSTMAIPSGPTCVFRESRRRRAQMAQPVIFVQFARPWRRPICRRNNPNVCEPN